MHAINQTAAGRRNIRRVGVGGVTKLLVQIHAPKKKTSLRFFFSQAVLPQVENPEVLQSVRMILL